MLSALISAVEKPIIAAMRTYKRPPTIPKVLQLTGTGPKLLVRGKLVAIIRKTLGLLTQVFIELQMGVNS